MADNEQAVEKNEEQAAASQAVDSSAASTEDYEAKIAALETEKENYKKAFLKEKDKNRGSSSELEETEDERLRRIIREEQANAGLTRIDAEKEELLKKLAKENKELKLASLNKPATSSAAAGSHTEAVASTQNTIITPEQERYFRETLKWSDKDLERYKKDLIRRGIVR